MYNIDNYKIVDYGYIIEYDYIDCGYIIGIESLLSSFQNLHTGWGPQYS